MDRKPVQKQSWWMQLVNPNPAPPAPGSSLDMNGNPMYPPGQAPLPDINIDADRLRALSNSMKGVK